MESSNPPGTVLESEEEIKRTQELLKNSVSHGSGSHSHEFVEQLYRPSIRPPVALLTIYDDGRSKGENIRIRNEQFVVGRTEGDLKLAFDEMLSSKHFAVTRQMVAGIWRWVVTDLQSRNGVFFRVSKAPLTHDAEFLVGGGCYKYQIVQNVEPETTGWSHAQLNGPSTKAYQPELPAGVATLSEIVRGIGGTRTRLAKDLYTIGRSTACDIVRTNDPFTAPVHVHLSRSAKGTWMIQNNGTRNGVWLRLPQIVIPHGKNCDFQAGEQRFRLSLGR